MNADYLREPTARSHAGQLLRLIRSLGHVRGVRRARFTGLTPDQTTKALALLTERGFTSRYGRLIHRPTAKALATRPTSTERNAERRKRKIPTRTFRVVTREEYRGLTRKERRRALAAEQEGYPERVRSWEVVSR